MEKCAYCGDPIGDCPVMLGNEVFCSEDCMDQFDTGPGYDYTDDRNYEGEDSAYNDF
jgi:hypothetical protein